MPAETSVFSPPEYAELPEHYAAIGRLIVAFSEIEHALNYVLRTLLGMKEEMARAVTGEMRAADLMASITRVLGARDRDEIITRSGRASMGAEQLRAAIAESAETLAELPDKTRESMDQLFKEIRILKTIRDDIAHRRLFVGGDEMIFSNAESARSILLTQFNFYTISDFRDLAIYACRLAFRAHCLLDPSAVQNALVHGVPLLDIPAQLRKADNREGQGTTRRERRRQQRSSPV